MGELPRLTPTAGFVLLEILVDEPPEVGFISSVSSDKAISQRAKVIAVGRETRYPGTTSMYDCPVQIGDIIAHSSYGYEVIMIDHTEYRLCPFDKILGIYGSV